MFQTIVHWYVARRAQMCVVLQMYHIINYCNIAMRHLPRLGFHSRTSRLIIRNVSIVFHWVMRQYKNIKNQITTVRTTSVIYQFCIFSTTIFVRFISCVHNHSSSFMYNVKINWWHFCCCVVFAFTRITHCNNLIRYRVEKWRLQLISFFIT